MVRMKLNEIEDCLTDEEKADIEATDNMPITYDDDSPQMTAEMLKQFHAFDAISIRVSRETINKVKAYDKDIAGFLSRVIEAAFSDNELIQKCVS